MSSVCIRVKGIRIVWFQTLSGSMILLMINLIRMILKTLGGKLLEISSLIKLLNN